MYSRKTAKNMFRVGVRKRICTATFLDAQELILGALGKQMSVSYCKSPFEKVCSRDMEAFIWWGLNTFLQADRCLGLVKCFKIFHFN